MRTYNTFLTDRYSSDIVTIETPEIIRKTSTAKILFPCPSRAVHWNKKYLKILKSNSRESKESCTHIAKSLLIRESENAHLPTFYLSVLMCNISIFSAI